MADRTKQSVQSQFGRQAALYTASGVHRHSEGLDVLLRLAAPAPSDRALDVATGTGFTALALAPRCGRIVGLDLTAAMVREARRLCDARALDNLVFCLGDAEAIPFRAGAFDLVVCRHAAHHFPGIARAIGEMARVVRPGGRVVLDDTCAPDDPALGALMNAWEARRDPSHVANSAPARLRDLFDRHGLRVADAAMTHVHLRFADWVRRAGVPAAQAAALRADFLGAPQAAAAAFQIRRQDGDVRFAWDEVVMLGIKRA